MTIVKVLFLSILSLLASSSIAQVIAGSATEVAPLMNGLEVPNATLYDLDNKPVDVKEITSQNPSVIIFYRGSWCPYCNRQLAGLQEVESQIRDLGFQIIAISPDTPENMRKTVDKNELTYTVLSDNSIEFAGKMGLAFVDHKNRTLPVPAVYLVDTTGMVQFNYVNPNYKVRPSPELLLKAAELMVRE